MMAGIPLFNETLEQGVNWQVSNAIEQSRGVMRVWFLTLGSSWQPPEQASYKQKTARKQQEAEMKKDTYHATHLKNASQSNKFIP